jgi:type IV secretory pathway VirB2 component (pilin)
MKRKVYIVCFTAAFVIATFSEVALASSDTPIGDLLCTVSSWFTGNTGKGLATIILINVSIWNLLGKISGRVVMLVFIGVAVIFGAGYVVDTMNASAIAKCS